MIHTDSHNPARARLTDPHTSHAAARSTHLTGVRATCLQAIKDAPNGLTSEELADVTGLSLVTVSPRLRPLAQHGLIVECGRRQNRSGHLAIVWMAVQEQGRLL